jgi:hypothetical protein
MRIEFCASASFNTLQLDADKVDGIRTLQLNGIALPPWQSTAELKCLQAGENIVVKPAT